MEKTVLGILIVVLLGGFIFITQKRKSTDETIKIGAIFALSGDAAAWGEDELKATQLAINEANAEGGINGKKIELIVEDAPGTEKFDQAITTYRKLVEVNKVRAVIGPTWDDAAQAVAPVTDQEKVILISPDVTTSVEKDKDFKYFFTAWTPVASEMERLAEYVKERGWAKIAVVNNADLFSATVAGAFTDQAKNLGLTIYQTAIPNTGTKDFRAYITKLKSRDVDAVYAEFDNSASKCPFLKQAHELGLKKPFISTSSTQAQDILNQCANLLEGVHYAYQKQGDKYTTLLAKYKAKYNQDPATPAVANAYDTTEMLISLMREGKLSADELRDGLLHISHYSGATGEGLGFDAKGALTMPQSSFIIKTVRSGAFVVAE